MALAELSSLRQKPVKILLIEDDLEDLALLEEAVAEIEESRFQRPWMPPCELVQAERLSEALELLEVEAFDVILLDLTLPGSDSLDAFLRLRAQTPDVPIIALSQAGDEARAISLVRQGAQDFIVKTDIDCVPLARSIRCAVERQRLHSALRSLSFLDDLTGLYSWGGFLHLADRYWKLAQRADWSVRLLVFELEGLDEVPGAAGCQDRDMALIRVADILRETFEDNGIIARWQGSRLAVLCLGAFDFSSLSAADRIRQMVQECHPLSGGVRPLSVRVAQATSDSLCYRSLEDLLEIAGQALSENRCGDMKAQIR